MPRAPAAIDALRVADVNARLLTLADALEPRAWRLAVARELRALVEVDFAIVAVEEGDDRSLQCVGIDEAVVRAYLERWATLDFGLARLRRRDRELWTRATLWRRGELARSPYIHEFAKPNGFLDAFGASVRTGGLWLRVALLSAERLRARSARQLRLLAGVLPALRTGTALGVYAHRCARAATRVIDLVPEPIGLYDAIGRPVHENPAFARAVAGRADGRLAALVQRVVRRVTDGALAARGEHDAASASGATGEWRVTGSLLPDVGPGAMAVLVSLCPRAEDALAVDALRARYALTGREIEVMRLLRRRRSNDEIAATLRISAATARHHTESVLAKLGLHSRREVERFSPEPFRPAGAPSRN